MAVIHCRRRVGEVGKPSDHGAPQEWDKLTQVQVVAPNGRIGWDFGDRERWLLARRYGIGASESAALLGQSPWQSALGVFTEKVCWERDSDKSDAAVQSEVQEWGHRMEAAIARAVAEKAEIEVEDPGDFTIFIDQYEPLMFATPDRLTTVRPEHDMITVEIKNMSDFVRGEWETEGIPEYVWIQAQQQCAVLGAPHALVAVLFGGQHYRHTVIDADHEFAAALRGSVRAFWEDHVATATAPPVTAGPTGPTAKALQRLYSQARPGAVVELPDEAIRAAEESILLDKDIAALTERRDTLRLIIKAAIGDAEIGMMPDGSRWKWSNQTRKEHIVPAWEGRVLRRLNAPKQK